jgi:hypothetical protein
MTDLDPAAIKAEWPAALNDPAVPVIHALCANLAEARNALDEARELERRVRTETLRAAAIATMPSDTDAHCRAAISRWLVTLADEGDT